MNRPRIGIMADLYQDRHAVRPHYVDAVLRAGGTPLILPVHVASALDILPSLHGLVLTGGGDIHMDAFGEPVHASADLCALERQEADLAVLDALKSEPDFPLLGVCLGMQLMGLFHGASLQQHLPDVMENAELHQKDHVHRVDGELGAGMVTSWHHQALSDGGELAVVARAPDGVVEAVQDLTRPYYLGVQWHPERTEDSRLGDALFDALIANARRRI